MRAVTDGRKRVNSVREERGTNSEKEEPKSDSKNKERWGRKRKHERETEYPEPSTTQSC